MEELKLKSRGEILLPRQEGYHTARNIWNGLIDKFPTLIIEWPDPAEVEEHLSWARSLWAAVEPFTCGIPVNGLFDEEGADRVKQAYGPNYKRLAQLKYKYDQTDLFNRNHNILPEASE